MTASASSTPAIAGGRRIWIHSSGPVTPSSSRCHSGRAPSLTTRCTWTGRRSAALAARTRAGRVLLTHLQMGFDAAATIESVTAIYDGPVDLVEPGARFLI